MKIKVTPEELTLLAEYIEKASGIVLDQSKAYLIESRLGPLLEKLECANYAALNSKARTDASGKIRTLIVDAISTNETSFFRDNHPFELLTHKLLPDHFERANGSPLQIWSAASSTGQEIYSIAIVLKELLGDLSKHKIQIMGTDISDEALKAASSARYTKLELSRGLSADRLRRHFHKDDGEQWRISDELRSLAVFRKANLMEPLSGLGRFDFIFCRNVAIYFSPENRKMLFDRLADSLKMNGALLIGSTETLLGVTERLTRHDFRGKVYYEKA